MNQFFVVGNITGDIYYDTLLIKGNRVPYLRMVLMSDRPRVVRGLRLVVQGEMATLYRPYLQRGSEILAVGALQTRFFRGKPVWEVLVSNLVLLRNINWEYGEAARKRNGIEKLDDSLGDANRAFVIGDVREGFTLERKPGRRVGDDPQGVAFLRLLLDNSKYAKNLRVTVAGALAELVHPYLRAGSRIAVDGHVQSDNGQCCELFAHNITFLANVDWELGNLMAAKLKEQQERT